MGDNELSEKDKRERRIKHLRGAFFIVLGCAIGMTLVTATSIAWDYYEQQAQWDDDRQDILDEMEDESTINGLYAGYSYSISNIDLNLSLAVSVLNETAYIDIIYQCEFYAVSCLLNDDGQYDLGIAIVGLYVNATITTSEGITGGALTIDEFYYEGVVDECTQVSIQDALMGVMELEQWSE